MEVHPGHGAAASPAGRDTQRHGDTIKELQREVRELASAVERLAYELHRVRERSEHQNEVTKLELKNEMLRFRQQLGAEPSSVEEQES